VNDMTGHRVASAGKLIQPESHFEDSLGMVWQMELSQYE